MRNNEVPRGYDPLIEHLELAHDGAVKYATSIQLKQNDAPAIWQTIADLKGSPTQPGLKNLWNTAKTDRVTKTRELNQCLEESRRLAMACVNTLKPALGNNWNSAWNEAGFTSPTLRIPRNAMVLLQQLGAFYEAHPEREVPEVNGLVCTAVACKAAAESISSADSAAKLSQDEAIAAKAAFEAGLAAGRARLTGLRGELEQLIKPDDPRWVSFGFKRPSQPTTPEVPKAFSINLGQPGSGQIFAEWPEAAGAESYRVRVLDATNKELLNEIVEDADFMAKGLPSGSTVQVTVSSRRGGLESGPSAPVSAQVP